MLATYIHKDGTNVLRKKDARSEESDSRGILNVMMYLNKGRSLVL